MEVPGIFGDGGVTAGTPGLGAMARVVSYGHLENPTCLIQAG